MTANTFGRAGMVTATFGTVETVRAIGGTAGDTFNVTGSVPGGGFTIEPNGGNDAVNVTGATAAVRFAATQRIGALTVNGGLAQLAAATGKMVLIAGSLNVTNGGRLDLTDEDMILDYTGGTPAATIRSLLTSGYAGGAWNGSGICSSVAASTPGRTLGYAEASALFGSFPATFAGQSIDASTVLIGYTISGDTNLDHRVDVTDLGRLASNWQQSPRTFAQGDFDYSVTVDVNDLGILASNWQQSFAGAGSSSSAPSTEAPISRSRPLRESIFSNSRVKDRADLIAALDQLR
jgi:hypothetical protein